MSEDDGIYLRSDLLEVSGILVKRDRNVFFSGVGFPSCLNDRIVGFNQHLLNKKKTRNTTFTLSPTPSLRNPWMTLERVVKSGPGLGRHSGSSVPYSPQVQEGC